MTDDEKRMICEEGEPSSPSSFLEPRKKWNLIDAELIPIKSNEREMKRNIAEIGKLIYIHIENQLKKSADLLHSTESQSQENLERKDDVK
jgi:hypothetical protein